MVGLLKYAKIFYRGMGELYIPDVLREGLKPGTFMIGADAPESAELANRYAHIGAENILSGDRRNVVAMPQSYHKARGLLEGLGVDYFEAAQAAPLLRRPSGGILKIDIPDDALETVTKPGGAIAGERIVTQVIDPEHISVVTRGVPPRATEVFPRAMTRLTPRDMRLLKAAIGRGGGQEAADIAMSQLPHLGRASGVEAKAAARAFRKARTRQLVALLTRL